MPSLGVTVIQTCVKMSSVELHTEDLSMILSERNSTDNRMKYTMLLRALRSPETKETTILQWLSFLRDNIYLLDKNEDFVTVLLQINWWKKSEESVIKLYHEVILNLVSAHTHYLSSVLQMIISSFYSGPVSSDAKSSLDSNENKCAHKLLRGIIRIVPMTPQELLRLLVEKFPYVGKGCNECLSYVTNLLLIIEYLPSYRQAILELIINRMLDIDVRCPKLAIEEMELEHEEDDMMFPTDLECDDSQLRKEDEEMKHPLANSLDLLMDKIFSFVDDICGSNAENLDWDETKKLYKDFLTLFDRLILPTYACVHVQFILFYICRLKWSLCEGFIDYLWKKVQNPNLPPVMRQVSAMYIGSLLARAKYISISSVRDVLDVMTVWIHKYIDQQSGNKQAYVDRDSHGTFYTVCQTIFYIFAFRHKELIEMENGLKYLHGLNFERMVNCRLNPLKVCLPSVVKNFANVTRNYQLVYCYTIIERNNRSLIPVVAQTSYGLTQPTNVSSLEVFFPFDPYLLKRSGRKIEPIYRIYEQIKEDKLIPEDEEFSIEEPSPSTPSVLAELEAFEMSPVFKKSIDIYR